MAKRKKKWLLGLVGLFIHQHQANVAQSETNAVQDQSNNRQDITNNAQNDRLAALEEANRLRIKAETAAAAERARLEAERQTQLRLAAEALARQQEEARILDARRRAVVYTNANAITIQFNYEDGSKEVKAYFAKQDKPATENAETSPIPIKADVFYAKDFLVENGFSTASIGGFAQIQAPSLKSIPKSDTTSKALIELKNPSSVSVYFGFENLAGVAEYSIYEKASGKFLVQSGEVDLHSTSDTLVQTRGIELTDEFDSTKDYILEIKHSGKATNDLLLDHKIYIGDVKVHRFANASNSVVETVSNDAFINNSYVDDGSRNSLTGRKNYVEFFDAQVEVCDGIADNFPIKGNAIKITKVELNNGRIFKELSKSVDWNVDNDIDLNMAVGLTFVPKKDAKLRITYETASSFLQRQIILTQPVTVTGDYDRYTDMYVQNEAAYMSIQSNID